ncbi:MAG: hypothetical protein EOO20_25845, partial [Chryseobacterium sp.]
MKTRSHTIRKTFLTLSILMSIVATTIAQTRNILKLQNDTTIIINLERQNRFGPEGNISYSIADISNFTQEFPGLLRENLTAPKDLTDVQFFYYIYNPPQFYYQNFKKNTVSLKQLEDELIQHRYALNDTTQLSQQPIKSGFYIATGRDKYGQLQLAIDKNDNENLSDDTVFVLPKTLNQNQKVTSPLSIDLEFLN